MNHDSFTWDVRITVSDYVVAAGSTPTVEQLKEILLRLWDADDDEVDVEILNAPNAQSIKAIQDEAGLV